MSAPKGKTSLWGCLENDATSPRQPAPPPTGITARILSDRIRAAAAPQRLGRFSERQRRVQDETEALRRRAAEATSPRRREIDQRLGSLAAELGAVEQQWDHDRQTARFALPLDHTKMLSTGSHRRCAASRPSLRSRSRVSIIAALTAYRTSASCKARASTG